MKANRVGRQESEVATSQRKTGQLDEPRLLPASKRDKTGYIIQKVIQALNVLEQFHDEVDELSLAQLSRRLELSEGSVEPLLTTLRSRNYLEQDRYTKGYRLGFKNLELAQTVLKQTDLYRISHPVLAGLAAECGETSAVAVLSKTHVVELDAVHCEHPVRVVPRVGVHLPVYCTAAGKVLLASLPEDALELLLRGVELKGYTPNTITSPDALKLELSEIAARGYAVDDEELDRDVRAVAAAIRDYSGRVVGAVVITGPSMRIDAERLAQEFIPLVLRGARDISTRLGYHLAPQPASDSALAGEPPAPPSAKPHVVVRKRKAAGTPHAA